MSLWDEAVAQGPDLWWSLADLALSGVYRVGGAGAGEAVRVLARYEGQPETGPSLVGTGHRSRYLADELTVLVQAAEVARPREGDTLTLEGEEWTVRQVEAGNELAWQVRLSKKVRASQG